MEPEAGVMVMPSCGGGCLHVYCSVLTLRLTS